MRYAAAWTPRWCSSYTRAKDVGALRSMTPTTLDNVLKVAQRVVQPLSRVGRAATRRVPARQRRRPVPVARLPGRWKDRAVANRDRLTALDTSFLHLEDGGAHMHVAAVMTFDGDPPAYDELVEAIESRLHLVPRYRQRLAFVPLGQGRPRWVDDPHFNPRYHIRHTALPSPGGDDELKRLAARVFGQRLDRSKPLWEIWLVEGLDDDRFAVLSKTHHALVDGVSGVDIVSVLFDAAPDPAPPAPPASPWLPRPVPTSTELLGEALLERATVPGEAVRGLRAITRAPRQVAEKLAGGVAGLG